MSRSPRGALVEVAAVFLKLGSIGFGGPAAHVALMREELVRRRRWVDSATFLDLFGVSQLIPGPSSTELALHLGAIRAGGAGLVVAGLAFITPAALGAVALAWAYLRFGMRPELDWLLYAVKPVVIALIIRALLDLATTALRSPIVVAAAALAFALALWGINPVAVLAAVAAGVVAARMAVQRSATSALLLSIATVAGAPSLPAAPFSLIAMLVTFAKIGSVVFGSGYVLVAFLRADLVTATGWLTDRELLDAIAIGQLTPGPVFTTATFLGYLLGGIGGAAVATLGIFLPGFVLVAATRPLLPRLRSSRVASVFLDGVNAASLALLAAVVVHLVPEALVDGLSLGLCGTALVLLQLGRVRPAWVILGAAAVGVVRGVWFP